MPLILPLMPANTETENLEMLRFPIGRFDRHQEITATAFQKFLADIEEHPKLLRQAVAGLTNAQLDTPYRPGGWTVRQVTHHLPESHLNAFTRIKLALTEQEPVIKPYNEVAWAELPDNRTAPVELSVALQESLHGRWLFLLKRLTAADLDKAFMHPESGLTRIRVAIGSYAWHGKHHVAHITSLRQRMGW
jgi:hypothetical protein